MIVYRLGGVLSVCPNSPWGEGGVVYGWGFSQEAKNFYQKMYSGGSVGSG